MKPLPGRQRVREIGEHVRLLRGLVGWSQERLARRARTSQGAVSRLEAGVQHVNLVTAIAVAEAFARVRTDLEGAISPPVAHFLAAVDEALAPTLVPTPEPALAEILRAYHALPPGQQAAFREIARAAVQVLGHGRTTP